MGVRGADQDGTRLDPTSFLDRASDRLHRLTANEEGVDADDGNPRLAVVEHHGASLARVLGSLMIGLAVPSRLLHADRR
jgi:hypothetical protein